MASSRTSSVLDMLLLVFSLVGLAAAQTWTDCDPLNRTCPANPALGTNATFQFANYVTSDEVWNTTAGPIAFTDRGMEFTIQGVDQAPTIQSKFYIMFGRVETIMQASDGAGIISSVVLQSDDLDEIDWEWVGNNASSVQSNYYGKGNTTVYDRGAYHDISPAKGPQDNFYNYTTVWTADKLEWWLNGTLLRTLTPETADPGKDGPQYPQTPMTLRLGSWPAGKKGADPYKIKWGGGLCDFSKGQSYTMIVRSVYVQDYGAGKEYVYGDRSGRWQSIKAVGGESSIAKYIWQPHGYAAVKQRWDALPKAAQIAIVAGALGLLAVLLLLLVFCCIRQRRAGRKERAVADAEFEKGAAELMEYRRNYVASRQGSNYSGGGGGGGGFDQRGQTPKLPSVSIMEEGRPVRSGWL